MDPALLKTAVIHMVIFSNTITWMKSIPLGKESRLSLADWTNYNAYEPEGTGTYAFGYDVEDPETNNIQYRDEERHPNGTIMGSYGYLRPDGTVQIAHYVADEKGYRVSIETHPRGQLRPYGKPDPLIPEESAVSPAMASALRSREVYKKQKVHEQRTRPIDKVPTANSRAATTSHHTLSENRQFRYYSSGLHEPSGFEDSFFDNDSDYEKFYRFFLNDSW